MKRKIYKLIAAVLLCIMLTACGEDPEMARFQKDIDDFCMKISEIDTVVSGKVNEIDEKIVEVNATKKDFTLAINDKI